MSLKFVKLAAVALLLPTAAAADHTQVASDPQGMKSFFADQGIVTQLETDDYGDPLLSIRYYDTSFSIYFYGCNDGTGCTSIQYFSGYRTEGSVSVSRLNEWNRDKRYARAYLSDSGAARIEYDVYLGADGMSQTDFDQAFSLWTRSMGEFEEFIDW